MGKPPLVSVVMNVRNGEQYLEEAVRSILNQSYRHFEFIVVDDGSTDQTPAILERLAGEDGRLRVFCQEQKGIYYSANRGCRATRGQYIARFDADDVSLPQRLERQVGYLEAHPEIAAVGTAVIRIDGAGEQLETYTPPVEPALVKATMPHWDPIVQPSVMMRTDCFWQTNGYREAYQLAGDYDLWMRMSERFELANLPEPLLYWRLHTGEVTNADIRKHTVYTLVAKRAAQLRQDTGADPLDNVSAVTPELLTQMGISEQRIQKELFDSAFERVVDMLEKDKPLVALHYLGQILDSSGAKRWRRNLAAKLARRYVGSYKNKGQLARNGQIFLWASALQMVNVFRLLRLKSRFFLQNRGLVKRPQFLPGNKG